ncbi:MAG: MBL fold metallo-hydrolase [Chitinophagales bacterium]|nr:MBL fold metallo-hydrolase [Chitinophagales bacterium]
MEITFLGTGTSGGVPLIGCQCLVCRSTNQRDKRLRTSILVKSNNVTLVVDCGPDFRQQMLREDVRSIDAILMTHQHKDHTGGIDDIRSFNFINKKPVDFYCDYPTELGIKEQYSYAFTETDYPYLPKMNFIRIAEDAFTIGDLSILPIEVMHANMPVKGFRFTEAGNPNAFTYVTDAKTIAKAERDKMRKSEVLVLNALREADHYSHLTVEEALEVVRDVKPRKTFFTHMSHQFGLHAEMEKSLPDNIAPAHDGLKIVV